MSCFRTEEARLLVVGHGYDGLGRCCCCCGVAGCVGGGVVVDFRQFVCGCDDCVVGIVGSCCVSLVLVAALLLLQLSDEVALVEPCVGRLEVELALQYLLTWHTTATATATSLSLWQLVALDGTGGEESDAVLGLLLLLTVL